MLYIFSLTILFFLCILSFYIVVPYFYKKNKKHNVITSNYATTDLKNDIKKYSKQSVGMNIFFWGGILVILITYIFSNLYVPENKVAIFYRFGIIQNQWKMSGFHFKSPFRDVVFYPTGIIEKKINNEDFVYILEGDRIPYLISIRRFNSVKELNMLTREVLHGRITAENAFYVGDFMRIIKQGK